MEERNMNSAPAPQPAGTEEERGLSIEEAFCRVQELIGRMEREDVPLEESFACYAQGMELVRYCNDRIDRVEKKVQMIAGDGGLEDFEQ